MNETIILILHIVVIILFLASMFISIFGHRSIRKSSAVMRDKCEMEEIWYLVKMDHDIDGKIDHFHPELKKNINDKVKELTEMGILNAQRPSGFESPKIIMFSGRHNKYAAFAIFVTKNEFFVYKYKKIKEVLDEIDKGEQ